ncbi:MAG TPA: hypothetical protein VJ045_06160 [Hyphomicrobiaceae bacterium]|nr:hypothetical protein [Hyphomicrobiaceae bacterium]
MLKTVAILSLGLIGAAAVSARLSAVHAETRAECLAGCRAISCDIESDDYADCLTNKIVCISGCAGLPDEEPSAGLHVRPGPSLGLGDKVKRPLYSVIPNSGR